MRPSSTTHPPDAALAKAFRDAYVNAQQENATILQRMIRMELKGKTKSEDFVEPATLKEVSAELELYANNLITALADAKTREDQSYILQDYLHETLQAVLFTGQTSLGYEALLNLYQGAEAQLAKQYKNDEHPWFERFSEVQEYGEMCYDTIFDVYTLVEAEQIAQGIPENERDASPYQWAVTRYLKAHPELTREDALENNHYEAIIEEAQEIMTECIEPFVGCLPTDIPLEATWFICRANELHDEGSKPIHTRIIEGGPKSPLSRLERFGIRTNVSAEEIPMAEANDNDNSLEVALKQPYRIKQIHDTLTHIFLCNLDAGSNLDHLLSAKMMLEEKISDMHAGREAASGKQSRER
jgi:hypothetical protein